MERNINENTIENNNNIILDRFEINKKKWKNIVGEIRKWVKGKSDIDDLTNLISDNLDEECTELKAVGELGVVGCLIDEKQLWRINASSNWSYYDDINGAYWHFA
jgi:hypothetical protein